MKRLTTRELTSAALVGGLYVVLSYFGSVFGLTFGPIQCRFAEALTVLPFLYPASAWGLFAGCVISNLLSPYGPLDLVFGSAATLLAGVLTARCAHKRLAALPPVVCNALVVGLVITAQETAAPGVFLPAFLYNALTIAIGQTAVCYGLGMPLLTALGRILPRKSGE